MDRFHGPAYRIETARLSLRCLNPADTPSLSRAIEESLEHLAPWLTWTAHEPLSLEERLLNVRTNRGHFDLGSDYTYGAFDKTSGALWGMGLLRMSPASVDERELGYWIHAAQVRRGLCTELASALVRVGFEIESLDALEIRAFPHNVASARVAERLGFSGPVLDPLSQPMPDGDKHDMHVYTLSRVEYAQSAARALALEAYDALERRIL
jgi:RimJ/RimL family protein N-acetyltransferase